MINLNLINIGTEPNDGTGDPLREAFGKINQMLQLMDGGLDTVNAKASSKPYVDVTDHGAKGDALEFVNGSVDGDIVSCPSYTFTAADIGKKFWVYRGWNAGDYGVAGGANIISVNGDGTANLDYDYGANLTNRRIIFGTDCTQAFEDAFEEAKNIQIYEAGLGDDVTAWRVIPAGGCVVVPHGSFLVHNTQARFDSGVEGAVNVPRNCSLMGQGMGSTNIVCSYGNYGHVVANENSNADAATQRCTLANFSVYGGRGATGATCLDTIHWSTRMGDYSNIDAYNLFYNLQLYQARRHGFYIKGRGENLFYGVWVAYCEEYGFYTDATQDSRWAECNAVATRYTGFYIKDAASSAFSNCKSFYCGDGGETDYVNSANWYIGNAAHSYRKGAMIFTGCEAQESRGSGWVIEGGLCQFANCLSSDPDRFGSGERPDIKAGFHLREDASNNVFEGCYARASLGVDWTNENHYGGDYAVYIDRNDMTNPASDNYERRGPRNNKGHIYTLEPSRYNVSKIGGSGTTNGMNAMLAIDGVFLNAPLPEPVTNASGSMDDSQNAIISYDLPDTTDVLPIEEVKVEYKLQADSDYTVFDTGSNLVSNSVTIPAADLTVDSDYHVRLTTQNREGYSLTAVVVSYTHSAAAPAQVTGVTANPDDTEMGLSWLAPENNGAAITDYVVEYKLSSEPTVWTTFADGTSTNTTATVTGLTNDSAYDFRVSAVNSAGTGTVSATVSATPSTVAGTMNHASIVGFWDGELSSATLDGSNVTAWTPLIGSAGDMTKASGAQSPVLSTVNSLTAIDFDGTDDVIYAPVGFEQLAQADNNTVIICFELDNSANLNADQGVMCGDGDDFILFARNNDFVAKQNGSDVVVSLVPAAEVYIAVIRRNGATLTLDINGTNNNTGTAADHSSVPGMWFGRVNQFFGPMDGKIAAIAGYSSTLSDAEVNARCNSLATRYGGSWTDLV